MDYNTEGCVGQQKFLSRSGRPKVRGLRRRTTMMRVVIRPGNGPRRVTYGVYETGPNPPNRFIMHRLNE